LAHQEIVVNLDSKEFQVPRVKTDPQDPRVLQETLDLKASTDPRVLKERSVTMVRSVPLAQQVNPVNQAHLVPRVVMVSQEPQDLRAGKERRVILDCLDLLVPLERMELMAPLDLMDPRVNRASLDQQAQLDQEEPPDLKDPRVTLEPLVSLEAQGSQAYPDSRVSLDNLVTTANLVIQAQLVILVREERWDCKAHLVNRVNLGRLESKATQVYPVRRVIGVHSALTDPKDPPEIKARRVLKAKWA